MSLDEDFTHAQSRIKTLAKTPSNDVLLKLYALFKQGTAGDVSGKRPGMLDVRGRAKYDAWTSQKGKTQEQAKTDYIAFVDQLTGKS